MIDPHDLIPVASVLKTHGVRGEVSCQTDIDPDELAALTCVFVELDGLYVPFFIRSVRRRGPGGALVTFEDVGTTGAASALAGRTLYAASKDLPEEEDGGDADGFYLSDMTGWEVFAGGKPVGILEDFDDSTANLLMLVRSHGGELVHIPAAEEFFTSVDPQAREVHMALPEGLLNLNTK